MFDPTHILNAVPKPVQMMVFGGLLVAYGEARFMTVDDFTKSYVLDLKREIRELRKDLKEAQTDRERDNIRDQIEVLLDDLCYELPNDPYCKDRA